MDSTALQQNTGFSFCYVFLRFNMPNQAVQYSQIEIAFASFDIQFLLFHFLIWPATDEVVSQARQIPSFQKLVNFINITLCR